MKRDLHIYLAAALLLAAAVMLGRMATADNPAGNTAARQTLDAGTRELGRILADLLWIEIDNYHHILMFQDYDWMTTAEYLPQLWLVIHLAPDFPDAYIDAGNHLAVNLGMPDEGLRVLDRGISNCPDNEKIFWERLVVLWMTDHEGAESTRMAGWDYLDLVRRKRGEIEEPWNEANASMIISFTFLEDTLRASAGRLALRYEERRDASVLIRRILHE